MTFTRSQLHERLSDLSGKYKAAQENKRLASLKRSEQDRLTDLARQADEKADELLLGVEAEIREAQRQYSEAVDGMLRPCANHGRALVEDEQGNVTCDECGGPYTSHVAQSTDPMLQHAESRVNGAFNEATR